MFNFFWAIAIQHRTSRQALTPPSTARVERLVQVLWASCPLDTLCKSSPAEQVLRLKKMVSDLRARVAARHDRRRLSQVDGKRGGPANSGRRECTAVGASLSQVSEIGMPDSVTCPDTGTVSTASGLLLRSAGGFISSR